MCPFTEELKSLRDKKKFVFWASSENLHTTNAGEGVEKREPSCTVGGNVNWYSHYGEEYGHSLKN